MQNQSGFFSFEEGNAYGHSIWNTIREAQLPIKALLLLHRDELVFERYREDFSSTSEHRMYSIAKSFVSIAIGLLADESKLSLSDPICHYFPEYLQCNSIQDNCSSSVHPWIQEMTIYDMLTMQTCFNRTTYKRNPDANWVRSFFITPPDHRPGLEFHYDTSSAHTLAALVQKLTGMKLMDYLNARLAPLHFSEKTYLLDDPFGSPDGGSGLISTPEDLILFSKLLSHHGNLGGKQLISKKYLDLAVSKLVDTANSSVTPTHPSCGYGLMFWRGPEDSYLCYGMGGQFIILCPQKELSIITVTDLHNVPGGDQAIAAAIFSQIYH